MWSPSSHSTGSPQDGRARSSTSPACRDVAAARAPPRPGASLVVRLLGRTYVTTRTLRRINDDRTSMASGRSLGAAPGSLRGVGGIWAIHPDWRSGGWDVHP